MSGRRWTRPVIRRPASRACNARTTVSTSGSSGTGPPPLACCLGCRLLHQPVTRSRDTVQRMSEPRRHERRRQAGAVLRLPRGRPRRQGRARPRRLRPRRPPLRPDERPDERRRPPPVEGGSPRLAGPPARDRAPGRGRRHRRHRPPPARPPGRRGPGHAGRHQRGHAAHRPRPGARPRLAQGDRLDHRRTPSACRSRTAASTPTRSPSASAT